MTQKIRKNVYVNGRRTCVSLEGELWQCFDEISQIEKRSISDLCTLIEKAIAHGSLTANIRIFILAYFQALHGNQTQNSVTPDPQNQRLAPVEASLRIISANAQLKIPNA